MDRGDNPWTSWTKEVRASLPESQDEARSSSWKTVAEGTTASQQTWSSSGSGWSRPSTWAAQNTANLTGQDHATDHEWYQHRKWHAKGWASDLVSVKTGKANSH